VLPIAALAVLCVVPMWLVHYGPGRHCRHGKMRQSCSTVDGWALVIF
jgi:hypothetical protein